MSVDDRTPITRRGALARLFTLGAAATVAVALPEPVQAAPVVPAVAVLPEWLGRVCKA